MDLQQAIDAWVDRNSARILAMEGEISEEHGLDRWLTGISSGVYIIGALHAGHTVDCPQLASADAAGYDHCVQFVKVGYAADLYQRFHNIKCSNPLDVEMLAAFAGSRADEKALHKILAPLRVRREWFRYTREVHELVMVLSDAGGFCGRIT